eukprot:gene55886-20285_t
MAHHADAHVRSPSAQLYTIPPPVPPPVPPAAAAAAAASGLPPSPHHSAPLPPMQRGASASPHQDGQMAGGGASALFVGGRQQLRTLGWPSSSPDRCGWNGAPAGTPPPAAHRWVQHTRETSPPIPLPPRVPAPLPTAQGLCKELRRQLRAAAASQRAGLASPHRGGGGVCWDRARGFP